MRGRRDDDDDPRSVRLAGWIFLVGAVMASVAALLFGFHPFDATAHSSAASVFRYGYTAIILFGGSIACFVHLSRSKRKG